MKILKIFLCMILCIGSIVPFTIYANADEISQYYTLVNGTSASIGLQSHAQWEIINIDEEYNAYTQKNEYTYQIVRNYYFYFVDAYGNNTEFSGFFTFNDPSYSGSISTVVSEVDNLSVYQTDGRTYVVQFSNKAIINFQSVVYYKNAVDYSQLQSDLNNYNYQTNIESSNIVYTNIYYKVYDPAYTATDQLKSIYTQLGNLSSYLINNLLPDVSYIKNTLLPDIKNQILITNSYLSNIDKNIEQLLLKLNNYYNVNMDTYQLFNYFIGIGGNISINSNINDYIFSSSLLSVNFNNYNPIPSAGFEVNTSYDGIYESFYIVFLSSIYFPTGSITVSNEYTGFRTLGYNRYGPYLLYYYEFYLKDGSPGYSSFRIDFPSLYGQSFTFIPIYSGFTPYDNSSDLLNLDNKNEELISATDEYDKVETEYINNATNSIDNIDFNLDLTSLNDFTPTATFVGNQMTSLFNINPALTTVFMFSMILGICLLLIGRSKK